MQRNRAAVITMYHDLVRDRIVEISKSCVSGMLDIGVQSELDKQHDILEGLNTLLAKHGGKRRDAFLLTFHGRIRLLKRILNQFGDETNHLRVVQETSVSRLVAKDAAYKFLHGELLKLEAGKDTPARSSEQKAGVMDARTA